MLLHTNPAHLLLAVQRMSRKHNRVSVQARRSQRRSARSEIAVRRIGRSNALGLAIRSTRLARSDRQSFMLHLCLLNGGSPKVILVPTCCIEHDGHSSSRAREDLSCVGISSFAVVVRPCYPLRPVYTLPHTFCIASSWALAQS